MFFLYVVHFYNLVTQRLLRYFVLETWLLNVQCFKVFSLYMIMVLSHSIPLLFPVAAKRKC